MISTKHHNTYNRSNERLCFGSGTIRARVSSRSSPLTRICLQYDIPTYVPVTVRYWRAFTLLSEVTEDKLKSMGIALFSWNGTYFMAQRDTTFEWQPGEVSSNSSTPNTPTTNGLHLHSFTFPDAPGSDKKSPTGSSTSSDCPTAPKDPFPLRDFLVQIASAFYVTLIFISIFSSVASDTVPGINEGG